MYQKAIFPHKYSVKENMSGVSKESSNYYGNRQLQYSGWDKNTAKDSYVAGELKGAFTGIDPKKK